MADGEPSFDVLHIYQNAVEIARDSDRAVENLLSLLAAAQERSKRAHEFMELIFHEYMLAAPVSPRAHGHSQTTSTSARRHHTLQVRHSAVQCDNINKNTKSTDICESEPHVRTSRRSSSRIQRMLSHNSSNSHDDVNVSRKRDVAGAVPRLTSVNRNRKIAKHDEMETLEHDFRNGEIDSDRDQVNGDCKVAVTSLTKPKKLTLTIKNFNHNFEKSKKAKKHNRSVESNSSQILHLETANRTVFSNDEDPLAITSLNQMACDIAPSDLVSTGDFKSETNDMVGLPINKVHKQAMIKLVRVTETKPDSTNPNTSRPVPWDTMKREIIKDLKESPFNSKSNATFIKPSLVRDETVKRNVLSTNNKKKNVFSIKKRKSELGDLTWQEKEKIRRQKHVLRQQRYRAKKKEQKLLAALREQGAMVSNEILLSEDLCAANGKSNNEVEEPCVKEEIIICDGSTNGILEKSNAETENETLSNDTLKTEDELIATSVQIDI